MDVSTVTGTAGNQTSSTAAPQTVDYQAFLRLLVAEMRNQDPTAPMDSTEYVAQLASFSQVEQSVRINDKLDQLLAAASLSQAGGLVGREITSADGSVSGTVSQVKIYSDGVMATLEGGEEIVVGPGVVIR